MPGIKKQLSLTDLDLEEGVRFRTNTHYTISLAPDNGILAGYLFTEDLGNVLSDEQYQISDMNNKKVFTGKTDKNGFFMQTDVIPDFYKLKVKGEEYYLVTLDEDDEPQCIAVISK